MADRSLTGHGSPAACRPATWQSLVAPVGPSAPAAHHGTAHRAAQGRSAASRGMAAAAWPKNERGNDANVMEREEHEL